MEILEQHSFPNSVLSVCVDSSGERVAVVVGSGSQSPSLSTGRRDDQTLHRFRLAGGRLNPEGTMPLLSAPEWLSDDEVRFKFNDTKVLFRDERTVLVARGTRRLYAEWRPGGNPEDLEVFALDWETGQERGRYTRPQEWYVMGLAPAPPGHILVGVQTTVICLEAASLREVCLARPLNAYGEPDEADVIAEEQLAPNGFAYDPQSHLLHILCGYFNAAVWLRYRFEATEQTFTRVSRREVEDYVPAGLCLHPDGSGVTASLQIMDELLDLWGRPVSDYDFERLLEEALAQQKRGEVARLQTARLGCLKLFSDDTEEQIDIYSEVDRDFNENPEQEFQYPDGKIVHYAYRLGAGTWNGGDFMTQPVYLDDRRVVVGTPNGFLQLVDTVSKEATVVHDLKSTINSLLYCPRQGLLLAGCENGTLTTFSV